jgi:hypothetical protein
VLTDFREGLTVILGGQPGQLRLFPDTSPVLASRFPAIIDFPGYTATELAGIFAVLAGEAGFTLTSAAERKAATVLGQVNSGRAAGWLRPGHLVQHGAADHPQRLVILNGSPGRQAIPFLTSDTAQVLWLVGLSLAAGISANLTYLAYDPPWLKSLGDLATTGIGLAAAIRIWQVFPFDLSSGWSAAVRVPLVVAIAGSCIALVVQIVTLPRWLTGHTPHGGRMRTGH